MLFYYAMSMPNIIFNYMKINNLTEFYNWTSKTSNIEVFRELIFSINIFPLNKTISFRMSLGGED